MSTLAVEFRNVFLVFHLHFSQVEGIRKLIIRHKEGAASRFRIESIVNLLSRCTAVWLLPMPMKVSSHTRDLTLQNPSYRLSSFESLLCSTSPHPA